jgi:subtilisin family serine protease
MKLMAKIGAICLVGAGALSLTGTTGVAEPTRSVYLVTFDGVNTAGVDGLADSVADRFGTRVRHTYRTALHGMSLRLTAAQAKELAADPAVASVAPDTPVHAFGEQLNPPSWGLDRIDQRTGLDQRYWYANEAEGVTAYVVDTGIADHPDFAGRVGPGVDVVDGDSDPADGNGHGTFISGIIGGTEYGVAKKITIVPVRVLDDNGSGSTEGVVAGIDWIAQHASGPSVANMSLGGSANEVLDDAVRGAIAAGVPFAVAAGGSASDAANFSPARVGEALTIGASGMDDCVSSSSNVGAVVDMFAPGESITGPWPGGDTQTLSGTSVSAPHVAGAVGIYLYDHPTATPAEVSTAMVDASTKDVLCNVPSGTPNRLLYTGP